MIHLDKYLAIRSEVKSYNASLIAVSKTKPLTDILELKANDQLDFGENYVQELTEKHEQLSDVNWHFIGHLQSNKVKYIAPFIHLIHGVDSENLLKEINKQGEKIKRVLPVLLQIFIATEESKFGFSFDEAKELLNKNIHALYPFVKISGFMGMASNTENKEQIRAEFHSLHSFFNEYKSEHFNTLSMGMTSDYKIALDEGSTMVRIGSAIFGERNYTK